MKFSNRTNVLANITDYPKEVLDIAYQYNGRDYNRRISRLVIDELLERMSDEDSNEFISYSPIITFMNEGMFTSVVKYLNTLTISSTLLSTFEWLKETLTDSDSV